MNSIFKNSFLGITLLLLISCNAQASLTDGLIAHYPFDGDASDLSGNGNHGTVYGAQLTEDRFGVANSAYLFNGQNNYIQVSRDSTLEPVSELTISLWAQLDPSQPMHARLLRKSAHQGKGYIFATQQDYDKKIRFNVAATNDSISVADTNNHDIYANEWHHFAGVYNQSTSSLFIDGELASRVDHQAGLIVHDNVDLYIGNGFPSPFGEYYRGLIDDIRIYGRAISDAEVLALATLKPVVTYPDGGEELIAGQTETIIWQDTPNISNVSIEYSDANGIDGSWEVVDANTPNDGSFEWTVPLVTSKQCLVRVSDVSDANVFDVSDDVFTIYECQHEFAADLNNDCYVTLTDFAIMASEWLGCANPFDPDCSPYNTYDGLVAYYKLDAISGAVVDETGNNNGVNDGSTRGVTGKVDYAFEFDGVDDYVNTSSWGLLNTDDYTISTWIKRDAELSSNDLESIFEVNFPESSYLTLNYRSTSGVQSLIYAHGVGDLILYEVELGTFDWYHILIQKTGSTTLLYLNGINVASGTIGTTGGNGSATCLIGGSNYWDGKIDDVRIYNRVLSDDEIEYLFQNP